MDLREIGLNKQESTCYLALLELGSTKTGPLIKKAGIASSKIYSILNSLEAQGLASHIIKRNIKYYQSSDPKTILQMFDNKKELLQNKLQELQERQKNTTKESVEMFIGQKAVFTLFSNLISDARRGEEYMIFSINEENKSDQSNRFFKNLSARRKDKGLKVEMLRNKKYYAKEKHTKIDIRYTEFNLPQGITLYKENTILLSWTSEARAILIKNNDMTSQLKDFFHDLWSVSKR